MAAGIEQPEPEAGPKFVTDALTLEAAASGLGAIAIRQVVVSHLRNGRLVMPFEVACITEAAYYLLYRQANATDPRVVAFQDWLLDPIGARDQREPSVG